MNLAPICIFTYNRPNHLRKLIESLKKNDEFSKSEVFIFCDGPHKLASKLEVDQVTEVRRIARSISTEKGVTIVEQEHNIGLASSIIDGVSSVVNKFGQVIVLEDDLILSQSFLSFMNSALETYKDEESVFHISGYWYPTPNYEKLKNTFFLRTGTCWGWATWSRAWKNFSDDSASLKERLLRKDPKLKKFNINLSYNFLEQLNLNISGARKTWAIKWYASIFLNNGLSLHPSHSYVNNIGHDLSGENCGKTNAFYWEKLNTEKLVSPEPLEESKVAFSDLSIYFNRIMNNKKSFRFQLKTAIKTIIPRKVKRVLRIIFNKEVKPKFFELLDMPRHSSGEVIYQGKNIIFPDPLSFYHMYHEIFEHEIYKFNSIPQGSLIIDCGSNIGLSILYFKTRHPTCRIIGFEADPYIFSLCQKNLESFNLQDVDLINKALWHEETTLDFNSDGSDGGRIASAPSKRKNLVVTTLLSKYINQEVFFLKIDIEGAELEVLREAEERLKFVENMFIEYHSFRGQKQVLQELLQIVTSAGFKYYISPASGVHNSPFSQVENSEMDLQLNIFCTRTIM